MAEQSRQRSYTWQDPMLSAAQVTHMSGLAYLQKIMAGVIAPPPIALTLNYSLVEVQKGFAVFEGDPTEYLYNPIGVVHGGWAATLLDSALGCAVQSLLAQGIGYTTIQLNINLVRPILLDTGRVRAEARSIHNGRQVATAEATLKDMQGKLLAHGTTTCAIFALKEA